MGEALKVRRGGVFDISNCELTFLGNAATYNVSGTYVYKYEFPEEKIKDIKFIIANTGADYDLFGTIYSGNGDLIGGAHSKGGLNTLYGEKITFEGNKIIVPLKNNGWVSCPNMLIVVT